MIKAGGGNNIFPFSGFFSLKFAADREHGGSR